MEWGTTLAKSQRYRAVWHGTKSRRHVRGESVRMKLLLSLKTYSYGQSMTATSNKSDWLCEVWPMLVINLNLSRPLFS